MSLKFELAEEEIEKGRDGRKEGNEEDKVICMGTKRTEISKGYLQLEKQN